MTRLIFHYVDWELFVIKDPIIVPRVGEAIYFYNPEVYYEPSVSSKRFNKIIDAIETESGKKLEEIASGSTREDCAYVNFKVESVDYNMVDGESPGIAIIDIWLKLAYFG